MAAALRTLGERFLNNFSAAVSEDEVEMAIYEKEDVELECLNLGGRPENTVDLDVSVEKHVVGPDKDARPSRPGECSAVNCTWLFHFSTMFRHNIQQRTTREQCVGSDGFALQVQRGGSWRTYAWLTPAYPAHHMMNQQRAQRGGRWCLVCPAVSYSQCAQASSSGCSTPSNLERAVLLLEEAESDREGHGNSSKAQGPKLAANGTRQGLGRSGLGESGAAKAHADDLAQRHADVRGDRSAVRAIQSRGNGEESMAAEGCADEGPSTPPTNSGIVRSSQELSSPGSAAGASHHNSSFEPCLGAAAVVACACRCIGGAVAAGALQLTQDDVGAVQLALRSLAWKTQDCRVASRFMLAPLHRR